MTQAKYPDQVTKVTKVGRLGEFSDADARFATFPRALAVRCIVAGSH